jgi:hypothetical protein
MLHGDERLASVFGGGQVHMHYCNMGDSTSSHMEWTEDGLAGIAFRFGVA